MLSRGTYIERGTIAAGLGITPWVTALLTDTTQGLPTLAEVLIRFGIVATVLGALGAALSFWLYRSLALRGIEWGGYEETAALLKQAGGELVTGKPEEKLFNAANRQADNQDGRATGIYLFTRMAQLRQTDSFQRRTRPNPIPVLKRLIWAVILATLAVLIVAWPAVQADQLPFVTRVLIIVLASPFFITALLILGLGLRSADAWLFLIAGLRIPERSTVKLRKREIKSAAGQWHRQGRGPDVPMFRVLFGVLALIAVLLYILREYDDVIFGGNQSIAVDQSQAGNAEEGRPEPAVTAAPRATPSARTALRTPRPAPSAKPVPVNALWARLDNNGTLVDADRTALSYAGWDLATLAEDFADYKRERLNDWYILHLRENPHDLGKVTFRLTVRPSGNVSDIRLIASQIGDSTFTNGLIDRLDAMQLGSVGIDAATITLAYDFRL